MAYIIIDDIYGVISEETLIQLTDDSNLGVPDTGKISEAIDSADSLVDGYAATRYTVPFSPVPRLIKALALDIAVYNLFSRRENVPENRKERHANAVKTCEMLAAGKITIGMDETPAAEGPGMYKARPGSKIFDTETMDKY
jgi:phage gp36-like protein